MNKALHIIPDFGNEEYSKKIENTSKEERDNAFFWYLHGKLEQKFNFDKAVIINCNTLGLSKPFQYDEDITINKLHLNGVVDCEVEGTDEPCVGYFWVVNEYDDKNWQQRGLVCLKSDKEACQYAEKKMNEKARIL